MLAEEVFFSLETQLKGLCSDIMSLSETPALGPYCPFTPQQCKWLHTSISLNGVPLSMALLLQLLYEMSFQQSIVVINSCITVTKGLLCWYLTVLAGTVVRSEAITLNSFCSFQLTLVPIFPAYQCSCLTAFIKATTQRSYYAVCRTQCFITHQGIVMQINRESQVY